MNRIVKLTIMTALLLVPALAGATHLMSVDVTGDCIGWSGNTEIWYRSGVLELDATFTVQLKDADGTVLETTTWTEHLTRDASDPQNQAYNSYGEWTYYGPSGQYFALMTVSFEAPYAEGVDTGELTEENVFFCATVPVETTSWSELKSVYR
jgi:hypothetical protein